ncbi:DUF3710 domain-containing protein [Pilimelia columellifera]|uniref:DUF3710 domain-containing protein n=1 Tax=Pilimelia columellifera subsp. columellifera TaxID=706583 RepID=A0ABP6AAD4_9ACTN
MKFSRRSDEPVAAAQAARPAAPTSGPYDISQAPKGVERLDLGALRLPAVEGVEVRVQADPDGVVQQVLLVDGQSALQIGVFAAPRTEGIWDEVREEIHASLKEDGLTAAEHDGEFGVELRAVVPSPEGPADIRFVGIDGPRWMVRGVFQGLAAAAPDQAQSLTTCLRELVVDRGQDAMPVREPLDLRLPREVVESAQAQQAAEAAGVDGAPAGS